jgi:hypothetical protein
MRDNYVQIAVTKDGGQTFGDWTLHHRGEVGEFHKGRVVRRRFGTAYALTLAIRDTSPVVADLIAVSLDAE